MNFESVDDETVLVSAVLSLTNPDPELVDRIAAEVFSGIRATIWESVRNLRAEGKPITPRNVMALHPNDGTLASALQSVAGLSWPSVRVRQAESTVVELSRLRRLQGALTAAQERLAASDSYSDALESAHSELARLDESSTPSAVRSFDDMFDTWWQRIQEPVTASAPIPTPWPHMDDKLSGGLFRGRTYVVGGRPGEGKSLAGINFATHAAENGYRSLVFPVEMGEHEVTSRVVASGAHAEYGQITRRQIDDYNLERIAEWRDSYHTMPLHSVDRADIGMEYVTSVCRSMKRSRGLDVVFVDYLQLLRPGLSKVSRQEQIADMSRKLKVLAMELDVVVVVACQLNRNASNEKRAPVLADLRESGAIEQDCDVAILLHHKREDNGDHTGDVELVIAKNRTGSTGTVTCRWLAYQARIGA